MGGAKPRRWCIFHRSMLVISGLLVSYAGCALYFIWKIAWPNMMNRGWHLALGTMEVPHQRVANQTILDRVEDLWVF